MIKVAIMKRGFISTLLTGATPGPENMIMNVTFLSKNDQIAHTGTKKAANQRGYERPFALIVNAQPLAHPWFL